MHVAQFLVIRGCCQGGCGVRTGQMQHHNLEVAQLLCWQHDINIGLMSHPEWSEHRRCEIEPDLDATSLSLLCSCTVVRCACTVLGHQHFANYDGLRASSCMLANKRCAPLRLETNRDGSAPFKPAKAVSSVPQIRVQQRA